MVASSLAVVQHVDPLSQADPAKAFHHPIQDLRDFDLAYEVYRYLGHILGYKAQARCDLIFYLVNLLAGHGQGTVDPLHDPEVHDRLVFQLHGAQLFLMAVAQADSADYAVDGH